MKKVLTIISVISVVCFIVLGMVFLLIQAFAVLTLNGALATSLGTLKNWAVQVSVISGVLCMALYYINQRGKKIKEE
jgi:hypothetical protein